MPVKVVASAMNSTHLNVLKVELGALGFYSEEVTQVTQVADVSNASRRCNPTVNLSWKHFYPDFIYAENKECRNKH